MTKVLTFLLLFTGLFSNNAIAATAAMPHINDDGTISRGGESFRESAESYQYLETIDLNGYNPRSIDTYGSNLIVKLNDWPYDIIGIFDLSGNLLASHQTIGEQEAQEAHTVGLTYNGNKIVYTGGSDYNGLFYEMDPVTGSISGPMGYAGLTHLQLAFDGSNILVSGSAKCRNGVLAFSITKFDATTYENVGSISLTIDIETIDIDAADCNSTSGSVIGWHDDELFVVYPPWNKVYRLDADLNLVEEIVISQMTSSQGIGGITFIQDDLFVGNSSEYEIYRYRLMPIPAPSAITGSATSVASTSATLNGTVNPNGASTTVFFEYGPTTSYDSTATAAQSPLTGTSSQSVSASLTGISAATTYHFRVKATNSAGTNYGNDQTFTTSAPPTTTTTTTTSTTTTTTTSTTTSTSATTTSTTTSTSATTTSTTTSTSATTTSATTTSATTTSATTTSATTTTPSSTTTTTTTTTLLSAPTMSIGSGSGEAGGSITLPIALANQSGASVAAISVDIEYESDVFKNLKATIGPAGEAADKEVGSSDISSGLFRVSVLSASNNDVIGNGVMAYLTLKIQTSALIGSTTLTTTASGSDPSGGSVIVNGSNGTVMIIGDIPGDCNGDGTVSIAEVQAAINMFLGINTIEDCVDVNKNGKVSIGEVQKVINKHLRINSSNSSAELEDNSSLVSPTFMDIRASSSDSSGIPSIDLGLKTGIPGGTVRIPLILNNLSGWQVSAVAADIVYDINILQNPTVEIGPAGSTAEKTVTSNEISSGNLRVGVLSISNNNIIADGTVAYVTFDVKADISDCQSTVENTPDASDPSGNDITVSGTDGVVVISVSPPVPSIEANGQDAMITVSQGDSVSVKVGLNSGSRSGESSDFWIAAATPFGWYSYVYPTGWKTGINLCTQTGLFSLSPPFEVLNMILPLGNYIFYFAVDHNADVVADATWLDSVEVRVE